MSKAVDQVMKLLETDPSGWSQTDVTLMHRKTGIAIWTYRSWIGCHIRHPPRRASFIDRIRLLLAVNRWHKNAPVLEVSDE